MVTLGNSPKFWESAKSERLVKVWASILPKLIILSRINKLLIIFFSVFEGLFDGQLPWIRGSVSHDFKTNTKPDQNRFLGSAVWLEHERFWSSNGQYMRSVDEIQCFDRDYKTNAKTRTYRDRCVWWLVLCICRMPRICTVIMIFTIFI